MSSENRAFLKKYEEINGNLLNVMLSEHPKQNVVFSPMSVVMALTLLAQATDGNTRDEIIQLMDDEHTSISDFIHDVQALANVLTDAKRCISANAAFVKDTARENLNPEYEKSIRDSLNAELIISDQMVDAVNKWVYKNTKGMIPEIMDGSMNDVIAVLINAACFHANWAENYEDDEIYEEEFFNADGSVPNVRTMHSNEDWYLEDDTVTGFIKEYKGKYSFVALLPKKSGKEPLIEAAKSVRVSELCRNKLKCIVNTAIPEFQYDFRQKLKEILASAGIRDVFTDQADFSPFSTEGLKVYDIIHKARIEVNQQGTRAAAATAFMVNDTGIPQFKEVRLDRPFLYFITESESGLPVFSGVINRLSE